MRGRSGAAGRPDRAERRRQDHLHRRPHRLRAAAGADRRSTGATSPAWPAHRRAAAGLRADVAVDRAVRRPDGARRTCRSPPSAPSGRSLLLDLVRPGGAAAAIGRRRTPSAASTSTTSPTGCPSELSHGQRKLVGVARALAAAPEAACCIDEPAAGLDSDESDELGRRLRAGASTDGIAMLLVDHDMGLVLAVCDHIYVLDSGRLIAEGTPSEIRRDPGAARPTSATADADRGRRGAGEVAAVDDAHARSACRRCRCRVHRLRRRRGGARPRPARRRRARSSPCSARTGPARRRRCSRLPGSCRRSAARSACSASPIRAAGRTTSPATAGPRARGPRRCSSS